jgi:hypothetical protein
VSKVIKLIEAMRNNPAADWSISDVRRLCDGLGWQCLTPSSGSHWKVVVPGSEAILTIPARRPIKPVYIRKLIAHIDEVGADGTHH